MTRFQLSEQQRLILGSACQRPDGHIFPVEHPIKGGAVGNVCKSLLNRGLIEEICCAAPDVVWRFDEALGPLTLKATPLAYSALGLRDDEAQLIGMTGVPSYALPKGNRAEQLIELLRQPGGVSMADIQRATGWQPHSIRGLISGTIKKKMKLSVRTLRQGGEGCRYELADL
jgi:Protein of unknown function (DUF3489)